MLGLVAIVLVPETTFITWVVVFDISDNNGATFIAIVIAINNFGTFVLADGLLGLVVVRVRILLRFGLCYFF